MRLLSSLFALLICTSVYAKSLTIAEIDEICTGWSGAVEVIAKDRDKGVPSEDWYARLYFLHETKRISYETYSRSIGFVELIYGSPTVSADALAFKAKETCVDYYLEVENI